MNGLETYWHENGRKAEEGRYVDDKREGLFIKWDKNGHIVDEETYKNGEDSLERQEQQSRKEFMKKLSNLK